ASDVSPEPPPDTGQRWPTVAVINGQPWRTIVDYRRTTGQLPLDHRSTSAGGDPLSDVSSYVAPCGDDVEIAKKAMAGFETMTSRS
ncbi:hypothetical protein Tco_0095872, partial [Tanacetum coccineum]